MTIKALLFIAGTSIKAILTQLDGSEEIEFTSAYDVFIRAGFETTICGVNLENPPLAKYHFATGSGG
jgi:putative intracellular protease/amidase